MQHFYCLKFLFTLPNTLTLNLHLTKKNPVFTHKNHGAKEKLPFVFIIQVLHSC